MIVEMLESVSAAAHEAWMASKRAQGVTSRLSETGEELMVPYGQLSEAAKDLDRNTVRGTLTAVEAAGWSFAETARDASGEREGATLPSETALRRRAR